jgi:hypothetical protein
MRSTVILTVPNAQKNIAQSVASILENTKKPDNLCIVFSNITTDNQWESCKPFFRTCCDQSFSEEITESATILTRDLDGINFVAIRLNKLFDHELKNYAIGYLSDVTDVFLTLSAGTEFSITYISSILNTFEDSPVGAVYSDYIENQTYRYLQSLSSSLYEPVPIKEFAFRKEVAGPAPFKGDNFSLVSTLYGKSIVKHIPKALYVA